jgi:hypothetical protein
VPWNSFGRVRKLLDATAEQRHPSSDRPAGSKRCGPLVLHVPDTHDRYYVLQFVDAWTNTFAYLRRRATGTTEADFLLVPDGYAGDGPDGMARVDMPSGIGGEHDDDHDQGDGVWGPGTRLRPRGSRWQGTVLVTVFPA